MPGFDTSNVAANTSAQPPVNPITFIGQLAQTRNVLNQNKMFPLEYQGQQLQNVGAGITNATNQQALQAHMYGTLQGLLAQTTDASEVPGVISMAIKSGLITPEFGQNVAGGNVDGLDPASITRMREQALSAAGNPAELSADRGVTSQISTGGGTATVNTKVAPGGGTIVTPAAGAAAVVPNVLGPSSLATAVETVDDTGAKHMGVMGDYVNPDGSWKGGTPHPLTALSPMDANTQATLGSAYGPQIASFEAASAGAPATRQLIENMRQEADKFDAGPQSDAYKKWGEFLAEYHIPAPDFASMDQTAAREAFAKTATMVLGAQQQALHMDQTDASRQTAAAAVPGAMTSAGGRQQVLGILEGNADMMDAAGNAWAAQKARGGPASWGQFQMEFPNRVPPSIFQAQYMTPAQIADMQKGWSAAKVKDWRARYDKAKELGWLPNAQ